MKNFLTYCSVTLILLMISFTSTSAQEQQQRKLSAEDKLFHLPKSGRQVYMHSSFSAEQIKMIDSMLVSGTAKYITIDDNTPECAVHYTYAIEVSDTFSSVEGKPLGIWVTDRPEFYHKAKQYGFKKLIVNQHDNIDSVLSAGFNYADMMYHVHRENQKMLNGAGAYYIDEPFEKHKQYWNQENIIQLARKVYPAPLFVGSYRWPNASLYNFFSANGNEYEKLLNNDISLPIYLMCDEYHGNCSGSTELYWNEFRSVYGKENNISNWINNIVNAGDGNEKKNCPFSNEPSSNFSTLITNANKNNLSELWLFAWWNYWNEDNLRKFCNTAFDLGWLNRKGRGVRISWKCLYRSEADPCNQCSFEAGKGFWIPVEYKYTGSNYLLK